ncbi:carbamoyltransferase C-terminal domain-containing protein [Streptomyces sp. NPDC001422]|uniref:carbamoyltransferase C-terminal domain-containing protein n=1 Tax=Streptomyces sp. NPDC001422 TaxID=3364575 RepID=UPI0036A3D88C
MNILGVSGAFGHDAAASLVVNGMTVVACEEERFTRNKRAIREAASHSVQACLDSAGLSMADIDCIAVGWDPLLGPGDRRLGDSLRLLKASAPWTEGTLPDIEYVPHHRAHAALGFHTSGFDSAAVIVVDGQGEDVGSTIFRGEGSELTEIQRFGIADSLGFFYAVVTKYLGFSPGSAGKTMGLAPFGEITYDFPELIADGDGYRVQMAGSDKPERMIGWFRRLTEVFGPAARNLHGMDRSTGLLRSPAELEAHHRNAAASAQSALERLLVHLAARALRLTDSTNLVLSGGVALNCSANGLLRRTLTAGQGLFVHGAAHDGGTALGAALAVAAEAGELPAPSRTRDLFLGAHFETGTAVDFARRLGLVVREPNAGVAESAARRLAASEVGAWFRGRAEYGPRALGGRSIIARSDDREVATRVNRIKGRELWRPLAPAMLTSSADSLGIAGDGLDFMVEARWPSAGDGTGPLKGIVHVDNSVRPLVVHDEKHPFHAVLSAVQEVAGAGTITNTSFNVEAEPMVNSPVDALRTFVTSGLDFLVLDDMLINKPA